MTGEEIQKQRRNLAEKIIAGEFKGLVVLLCSEEGIINQYYEGGRCNAIGLCYDAASAFIRENQDNGS